jgi:hypothetical protein
MSKKNSNDTIEPATFRFVAQYLNHCATISDPRMKVKILLLLSVSKLGYQLYKIKNSPQWAR